MASRQVVVATTKVHIFKQITTILLVSFISLPLLLLPQRYIFSSKSQHHTTRIINCWCCCCYHKGTYFQANHNRLKHITHSLLVVVATTKVHIFKQITTTGQSFGYVPRLLLLPQRYIFSSKSQHAGRLS